MLWDGRISDISKLGGCDVFQNVSTPIYRFYIMNTILFFQCYILIQLFQVLWYILPKRETNRGFEIPSNLDTLDIGSPR